MKGKRPVSLSQRGMKLFLGVSSRERGYDMTRKRIAVLLLFLVLLALAALYFFLPRPVLRDPAHTVITAIVIQKDPYYQEGPEDKFVWTPETAEDQALARELVDYLAGCKQTGTLLREPGRAPLTWKTMSIHLEERTPGATSLRSGSLILGPARFAPGESPEDLGISSREYRKAYGLSALFPAKNGPQFLGRLQDPDGIRAHVLDALDLPADFL